MTPSDEEIRESNKIFSEIPIDEKNLNQNINFIFHVLRAALNKNEVNLILQKNYTLLLKNYRCIY